MKRVLSRKWTLAGLGALSAFVLIGALLLTGVLPGLTRSAHASASDAGGGVCDLSAHHSVCSGKSVQAYAAFYSENGCLSTDVSVDAFQDVSHSATDPLAGTNWVMVFFYQYDTCSFSEVANAEGQATGVSIQGDSQLNGATLNATVPLTGSGVPDGYSLTIDLVWHGIGDTRTTTDDYKTRSSSGVIITRTSSVVRSAVAMGTITDGTTSYASNPALNSSLFDSYGKQIVIDHP